MLETAVRASKPMVYTLVKRLQCPLELLDWVHGGVNPARRLPEYVLDTQPSAQPFGEGAAYVQLYFRICVGVRHDFGMQKIVENSSSDLVAN